MFVDYVNGIGTENSYANLQGSGTADVFTAGREVTGTWSRGPSKADVITYQNASGETISLTPGQTWVELLNDGRGPSDYEVTAVSSRSRVRSIERWLRAGQPSAMITSPRGLSYVKDSVTRVPPATSSRS
jgi:hypothetical protein